MNIARYLMNMKKKASSPTPKMSATKFEVTTLKIQLDEKLSKVKQYQKSIDEEVASLCTTPDDEHIICGGTNGSIYVFSLKKKKLLYQFPGVHDKAVQCIALSSDNKYIISGSSDGSVRVMDFFTFPNISSQINNKTVVTETDGSIKVLDVKTRALKHIFNIGFDKFVQSIAITYDNNSIITGLSDGTLLQLDMRSKEAAILFEGMHERSINCLCLTADNRHLVTGSDDQCIRIFQLDKKIHIFTIKKAHDRAILSLCVTNDVSMIISGSDDRSIRIFDFGTFRQQHTFTNAHDEAVTSLSVSHDSKFIISGSRDGSIRIFDLQTKQPVHAFHAAHQRWVMGLRMSSDNRYIVSGSYDRSIKVIDLEMSQYEHVHTDIHSDSIVALAISKNSKFIVTGSHDRSIKLIDMDKHEIFHAFEHAHDDSVLCIAITGDDRYIVSGSSDRSIRIFDINTKQLVHTFNNAHDRAVSALVLTFDDQFIVSGSDDKSIRVFDLKSKSHVYTFENEHEGSVQSIAMTADSQYIVTGSLDRSIRVYSLKTRNLEYIFSNAHDDAVLCVAMSIDDKYIISSSDDRSIRIFDFETKQRVHTFKHAQEGPIHSLTISGDNRYIIAGSSDRSIKLFDLETKRQVHSFDSAHDGWVLNVKITNDQKYIVSASSDQSVRVFQNPFHELAEIYVSLYKSLPSSNILGLIQLYNYLAIANDEEKIAYINKYPTLFISPYGWNHFHLMALEYPRKQAVEACLENKIPFILDNKDLTPLHYLIKASNRDLGLINFVLGNFDEIILCSGHSQHEIMSSLTDALSDILLLDTSQVATFLRFGAPKPKPFGTQEVTRFGTILGRKETNFTEAKTMKFYPEIKDRLIEDTGNTLIAVRVIAFFLNYHVYSDDMFSIVTALNKANNEDIFRTKVVSILLEYLWKGTKGFHYFLMSLFSVLMVCLSIIAVSTAQGDRIIALEVITFVLTIFFFAYELVGLAYSGIKEYLNDIYNYIDISSNILLIVTILCTWGGLEGLGRDWLFSVTLLFHYTKWFLFFRVFDQTRKLIRICVEIIRDIRSFVMLLVFVIVGFSIMFFQFDNGEVDYPHRLLKVYEMLYGAFETSELSDSQIFYFVVVMAILAVILLNLLVAIMGDTYQGVQAKALLTDSKERVGLILEAIIMRRVADNFCKKRQKKERKRFTSKLSYLRETAKQYLFYVQPSTGEETEDGTIFGEWETRANLIKKIVQNEVRSQANDQAKQIKEMEIQFENRFAHLENKLMQLDTKLDKITNSLSFLANQAENKKEGGFFNLLSK